MGACPCPRRGPPYAQLTLYGERGHENACMRSSSAEGIGIRICRDVFRQRAQPPTVCSGAFPANRPKADARTRTGDPFITRERQVRDARPLAGRAATFSPEIGL